MNEEEKNVDEEVVNGSDTSVTEDEISNQQEQITKTYSEEEVEEMKKEIHQKNQEAWNKRWGQEKTKLEREYAKKDELVNLLQSQTSANSIDDLLNMSYAQYGVERQSISNSKDDEVLGKYDAKEILELDDESIEEEANRLAVKKRTAREDATFKELGNYLTSKKNETKIKNEIKEAGIDEKVLEDEEFKSFMNKFNKDTSVKEIYDIYSKTNTKEQKEKPFSPGSLKDKKIKFWKVDIVSLDELKEKIEDIDNIKPGTVIVSNSKEGLYIKTIDGIIKVLEIQGENAKKMSISDFLRGNTVDLGAKFV